MQDNINFLREQLKNKDEIINSLLEQLSKRDDVLFNATTKKFHQIQMSLSPTAYQITVMVLITLT